MEKEVLEQLDSNTIHEDAMLIVFKRLIRIYNLTPWKISQITDCSEDDINSIITKQKPLPMGFIVEFSTNILLKRTQWEQMVNAVEALLKSGYDENSLDVRWAILTNLHDYQ